MSKQIAKSSNKRIKKNNVPSIKHPSTISPSTEKMSLMNISQRGMEITDKSTHLMNQKILADFLSSIPLDKGWWFRVHPKRAVLSFPSLVTLDTPEMTGLLLSTVLSRVSSVRHVVICGSFLILFLFAVVVVDE